IETSLCLELRLQSVAYALKILLFLGAAAGYFDQMVSERSLDGIAHAADLEAERGVHKLCDKGRLPIDPSQGAAFLAAAAVIRVLLGERREVFAGLDPLQDLFGLAQGAVPISLPVDRLRFDQDVAHFDLLKPLLINSAQFLL